MTVKKRETVDYRIEGLYTLLSPLSHIGESVGASAFLATEPIVGIDGSIQETFVYSGNSIRGIIRDAGMRYLLERLRIKIPVDSFHLLFSGGSLGGEGTVDIDQARLYRKMLPMFSILGGGVGNQLIQGKVKIGSLYPLCRECQRVLPEALRDPEAASWRQLSFEKEFTRMDDSKNDNLRKYMIDDDIPKLEGKDKKKKKGDDDEKKQQMRASTEMMITGTRLYQRIDLVDFSELELGAYVSAWHEFARQSYIGGKSGTGYGSVDVTFTYKEPFGPDLGTFLSISGSRCDLSPPAADAKARYDEFLLTLYETYLQESSGELRKLLGGVQAG